MVIQFTDLFGPSLYQGGQSRRGVVLASQLRRGVHQVFQNPALVVDGQGREVLRCGDGPQGRFGMREILRSHHLFCVGQLLD
jgi:hypothetical protein